MRHGTILVGALVLLAGCGDSTGSTASRTPAPSATPRAEQTPRPASDAPVLVQITQQRLGGLLDKITIRTDGTGLFDRPSGGVGRVQRDVIVQPSVLRGLRAELKAIPERVGKGDGSPAPNAAAYIVRYRGKTFVARQGAEPAPLRRPIRRLAAMMLVGKGIREVTRERLGGVAGGTHSKGVGKAKKAPTLVFCQRQGEGGATLDAITVRRDGSATLEKRHGGAGGRFKEQVLRKGVLPKLRRALAALPAGESLTRGSPPAGGTQFILRYRGRTQTAREGGIVPRARDAVELLDGLINGVGVRRTTRERATHTY